MKIYVLKYDLVLNYYKFNIDEKVEPRVEMFHDISEFITAVKSQEDKLYIKNIKVYSGEIPEISLAKVINPF